MTLKRTQRQNIPKITEEMSFKILLAVNCLKNSYEK